ATASVNRLRLSIATSPPTLMDARVSGALICAKPRLEARQNVNNLLHTYSSANSIRWRSARLPRQPTGVKNHAIRPYPRRRRDRGILLRRAGIRGLAGSRPGAAAAARGPRADLGDEQRREGALLFCRRGCRAHPHGAIRRLPARFFLRTGKART